MGAGHQKQQPWSLSLPYLEGVLGPVNWPMTQLVMPVDENPSRNSAHQSSVAFLVGEHMMCYQGEGTEALCWEQSQTTSNVSSFGWFWYVSFIIKL